MLKPGILKSSFAASRPSAFLPRRSFNEGGSQIAKRTQFLSNHIDLQTLTTKKIPCGPKANLMNKEMLPIVTDLLPQMLPFKPLTSNDVTDVTAFPNSYISYATHPMPHRSPLRAKASQPTVLSAIALAAAEALVKLDQAQSSPVKPSQAESS